MSGRSPADVLRAMVAMFNTGDVAAVDNVVHPDYLDHQGLSGEPMRGADGFADVVRAARAGRERLAVEIADLVEGDDRVAARLVWRAIPPSREATTRETVELIRVQDGRAIEHWGGRS